MKRKFISIFIALVLALSLCLVTAVPVAAQDPVRLNLISVGVDSVAEWVDAETMAPQAPRTGAYSLKLYALEGNAGGAGVYIPVNVAIEDINSLSFSRLGTTDFKDAKVNLLIDADNDGDLDFTEIEALTYHLFGPGDPPDYPFGEDAMLFLNPNNLIDTDTWATVDAYSAYKYWGIDKTGTLHWTENSSLGAAGGVQDVGAGVIDPTDKVLGVIVLFGCGSGIADRTVYIDDIKVNGVTYELEEALSGWHVYDGQSIQDAIDIVASGDTINVAEGTYAENVSIGEPLILLGAQAGNSAIGRTDDEAEIVGGITVGFGVSDFTIDGFKITQVANNMCMNIESASATIINNIIVAVKPPGGYATNLVYLNGVSTANIQYNDFSGEYNDITRPNVLQLVIAANASTVTVANNEMHDVGGGGGIAITGNGAGAVIKIIDNVIDNTGDCIWTAGPAFGTLLITGNDLVNCHDSGLGGTGSYIGVKVAGGVTGDVQIHNNNIEGNELGVYNDPSNDVVNATNNYWGHPSGPKHNPGLGDPVSGNVLFNPWLLELGGDTYDKTLALNIGWTLISTDNWISAASLVGEDVTLVVNYIPGQKPGEGWSEVIPADLPAALVPVDALYVKTVEGGGLGINYSGGVPIESSKDLVTGWNLISSAIKWNARDVLSPLRYIDVGEEQGVGLATLVSQGDFNQHTLSFTQATFLGDWTGALSTIMLNPFDGYWVYMNAPKNFGVVPD